MKNTLPKLCVALLLLNLTACAVPGKDRVRYPVADPPPVQSVPTPQPAETQVPDVPPPAEYPVQASEAPSAPFAGEGVELPVLLASVSDRIFAYGGKLERWKELDSQAVESPLSEEDAAQMVRCFRRLQDVLGGYNAFRSELMQRSDQSISLRDQDTLSQLQLKDIEFLETSCGVLLGDAGIPLATAREPVVAGGDLAVIEKLIDDSSANNQHGEILQTWSQLAEEEHGRVRPKSKILVANAMVAMHQEEKAAELYQGLVEELSSTREVPSDLLSLRKILADLYIASGRYGAAALQYQQIVDDYQSLGALEDSAKLHLSMLERATDDSQELKDYGAILRNQLGYVAARDGFTVLWQADKFLTNYPYSPVAPIVDSIRGESMSSAEKWFADFLGEVDRLAAEKNYAEALKLLATMPSDIIGTDQQLAVQEKNDALLLAEAVDRETVRMSMLQELQNRWNNAMLLAKEGRYDEALAVFSELLDTDYGPRAAAKIEEIALEAASSERKKAADIFIRYTKTTDLESRKKLLIETRRVLKGIPEKYPNAEIIPKVIDNIRRVEEEMNSIDPQLIRLADEGEPVERIDGIDQVFAPIAQPSPPERLPLPPVQQ
jgi:tetratricopeptide (TPR) repeat protein